MKKRRKKLLRILHCTYGSIRFVTLTEKSFLVLFLKKNTLAFFACYLFERLLSKMAYPEMSDERHQKLLEIRKELRHEGAEAQA